MLHLSNAPLKKLWWWKFIWNAQNSASSNKNRFSALFSWIIKTLICMTNYNLSNKTPLFDKLTFSVYHIWVSGIRGKIVLSPQQVVSKCWKVWCAIYIERISVSKIKLAVTSMYFCWTLDQNMCVNLTLVFLRYFL